MASPETGSEKHRDRAREVATEVLRTFLPTWPAGDGEINRAAQAIAAALARVEAETLERAARYVEGSQEFDASDSAVNVAIRNGMTKVLAASIRALAPEPVAGDAHPKNETSS